MGLADVLIMDAVVTLVALAIGVKYLFDSREDRGGTRK